MTFTVEYTRTDGKDIRNDVCESLHSVQLFKDERFVGGCDDQASPGEAFEHALLEAGIQALEEAE